MASYSPYGSPFGSTPGAEYYYEKDKFASPSPTPSPRGTPYYYSTPQRPATRAHFRHMSGGLPDSPRYRSTGEYATGPAPYANVSVKQPATPNVSSSRSSRKQSWSSPRSTRQRRSSYSYYRASETYGESDEDEYIEINGVICVLPARSSSRRSKEYYFTDSAGYGTDHHYSTQAAYRDEYPPRAEWDGRRPAGHSRRASAASVPQRPATTRPSVGRPPSSHRKPQPAPPKATEADARRYRIPAGYSLKNWDPSEEPIVLLGSVFDANSLGKWIFDWTVYHHGPATPIAEMAGELWLLLIQLAGKVKRAEDCVPKIRLAENKETIEDFIEAGGRLTDKLRKLLKTCEAPMLKAATKRTDAQLGKNAGVEFVKTLFGRDRELEKTEVFMQNLRVWNHRFEKNCDNILNNPTI